MKKISLKNLQIDSKEMLTKEQLKNVFGGDSGVSGSSKCKTGPCTITVQISDGSWHTYNGNCGFHGGTYPKYSCHCQGTPLGMNPYITSNGGVSRCTP